MKYAKASLMHLRSFFIIFQNQKQKGTRENKVTETHMIGPEEESSQILEVLRGFAVFLSSLFFQNLIEKLKNWRHFYLKSFSVVCRRSFLKSIMFFITILKSQNISNCNNLYQQLSWLFASSR